VAERSKVAMDRSLTLEAALCGVLALLIDEREARTKDDRQSTRTEVLLADAGLSIDQIATVMGKSYDAVRKAIYRGRARKSDAA